MEGHWWAHGLQSQPLGLRLMCVPSSRLAPVATVDFCIIDLMGEDTCDQSLVDWSHPPVCGVVERDGRPLRLRVGEHADGATLQELVRQQTWPGRVVNTDEWGGFYPARTDPT